MGFFKKLLLYFSPGPRKLNSLPEGKRVRAREEDGRFIADDPDTKENEAWVKERR